LTKIIRNLYWVESLGCRCRAILYNNINLCYNKSMNHPDKLYINKYISDKEPYIIGLQMGEVRHDNSGNAQVYLGGETIDRLTLFEKASLRDDKIQINMYTIDGRTDIDYAEKTINPSLCNRTATERGKALRFGGTNPKDIMERTPVQFFTSNRAFADLPISGRVRWLTVDPDGNFSEGIFDGRDKSQCAKPMLFGKG